VVGDTAIDGAVVSIAIGLLLGLERERSRAPDEPLFAGIRTFPLLVLAGFAAAQFPQSPFLLPATVLAVGALSVVSYLRTSSSHVGATTEAAAALAPLLGALVATGRVTLASALTVLVALLLTLKASLHRIAGRVSADEVLAVLKFGLVGVVLLPVLPTTPMGPYDALVPRHVGIVVLTLCGFSLAAYVLVRLVGGRTGWVLAGALGGLVSSTVVTLSFAGKGRGAPGSTRALGMGIVLASIVLYARGIVLAALFDPALAAYLAPRLVGLLLFGIVLAGLRLRGADDEGGEAAAVGNPVELARAATLGLLFAAILVGARAAQVEFGTRGLWSAALLGGLVDVDSVVVAAARLSEQGLATAATAGVAFLLATVANLVLKSAIVAVVGGRALARQVLPVFGLLALATLALLGLTG
jgi:uncharacterized membrane protein (DUF4010 family)